MSFLNSLAQHDPIAKLPGGRPLVATVGNALGFNRKPPPPPGVPNPNDAANAALQTTDAMRMRRGMLANIYAGAGQTQPVTGKTQLGT